MGAILNPRILTMRLKHRFNRALPYHHLCLGAIFCLRTQVYDFACWKHQDVYDRRAARRLKRARKAIIKRRRQQQQKVGR